MTALALVVMVAYAAALGIAAGSPKRTSGPIPAIMAVGSSIALALLVVLGR